MQHKHNLFSHSVKFFNSAQVSWWEAATGGVLYEKLFLDVLTSGEKQSFADVLHKIGVLKILQMLESLFNKVAGLRPATLLKRDFNICVFLRNVRNF